MSPAARAGRAGFGRHGLATAGFSTAGFVTAAAGLALTGVLLFGLGACSTSSTSKERPAPAETSAPPQVADPAKRARARMELASAYFGQGQSETALGEIKQAIEIDPRSAEAYNLAGLIYASLADPPNADQSFRRSLELSPDSGSTLHNYGWFQCQQGHYAEAQATFKKALALPRYRDVPRTMLVQGVCFARDARLMDADQTLSRAFELDPANPAISVNLAEVLYRRGEYDRARFYIRRLNGQTDLSNAQTLWLGVRIERRAGNRTQMNELAEQLRNRFPESREAAALEQGRFDE